jgi:hypothetical protein
VIGTENGGTRISARAAVPEQWTGDVETTSANIIWPDYTPGTDGAGSQP